MSIIDFMAQNPLLVALGVLVAVLIALGAYKLIREFLPW